MIAEGGSFIDSTSFGVWGVLLSSAATIVVGLVTYLGKRAEEQRQAEGPDAVAGYSSLSADQQREREYLRTELDRVRAELGASQNRLHQEQGRSTELQAEIQDLLNEQARLTVQVRDLSRRLRNLEGPVP